MKKGYTLALSVLGTLPAYSYIYDITIMRRWNRPTRSYQYVIGCSDYHDATHPYEHSQRRELLRCILSGDPDKTLVVVEDLASPNGSTFCNLLSHYKGLLAAFATDCSAYGVAVCNIEHRYVRVRALSDLIAYPEKNFFNSKNACIFRVGQLYTEVTEMLDEIRAYQDCLSITLVYQQICAHVQKSMRFLQLTDRHHVSIAEWCQQYSHLPAFIKRLLTFDSRLVDCKGVHAILNAPEKDTIVLLAGGTHVERITKMLTLVGFEKVHHSYAAPGSCSTVSLKSVIQILKGFSMT